MSSRASRLRYQAKSGINAARLHSRVDGRQGNRLILPLLFPLLEDTDCLAGGLRQHPSWSHPAFVANATTSTLWSWRHNALGFSNRRPHPIPEEG